jgi:hypothetical protein
MKYVSLNVLISAAALMAAAIVGMIETAYHSLIGETVLCALTLIAGAFSWAATRDIVQGIQSKRGNVLYIAWDVRYQDEVQIGGTIERTTEITKIEFPTEELLRTYVRFLVNTKAGVAFRRESEARSHVEKAWHRDTPKKIDAVLEKPVERLDEVVEPTPAV